MASIKVAVRVRPINQREINLGSTCIISMEGKKTSITNMKIPPGQSLGGDGRERVKSFTYDYSYWSVNPNDKHFASQKQVFENLGTEVLQSAFEGYNACIFAYGQTGSGKSYTMMGAEHCPGLIPRICEGLYQRIQAHEDDAVSYRTEVSFVEIYCERVRDLLRNSKDHSLKVREHPRDGPYVQNLSKHLVSDYQEIQALMDKGNSIRTTASTNMNNVSSRSHAIFTIKFTQAKFNTDMPSETVSKINLVDLAGSERADATGATGERLKEGANINKSLVTLGNVISALADVSSASNSPKPVTRGKRKSLFIPYRDSVLTWLLKDSLGGNSKTIMVATISPADVNYGETLSTLRYANRAKNIINKPTINEDPNVKLIRELRAEITSLKLRLGDMDSDSFQNFSETSVVDRLHENEERVKILTEEWATKWKDAQKLMQDKNLALRSDGNTIMVDFELPHLITIDDDILSTGLKLYHIHEGKTMIGNVDSDFKPDIALFGHDVEEEHCYLISAEGKVWLHPEGDAICALNGKVVTEPKQLTQGSLISIGKTNLFRFNHPADAQRMRHELKSNSLSDLSSYRSTENLLASTLFHTYGLDREQHRDQFDTLEAKRSQIEELEQKYKGADMMRQQKLEEKEKELKELQQHLEKFQQNAGEAEVELQRAAQSLNDEKKRLARRSMHLMDEVEKFNQEREEDLKKTEGKIKDLEEEKRLLLEERDEVILSLVEEKKLLQDQIVEEKSKVDQLERQKSEELYQVKKDLLEQRGSLQEKVKHHRAEHSIQAAEMEAKGKDLDEALKKAQEDFDGKKIFIQRERDEERHFLDMESQKLDALRAKQQLAISLASKMEESVRKQLKKESHEIAKARDEFESRKQAQLEALEEAEKAIESKVESLVNDIWESRSKLEEEKSELDKLEQEKKTLLKNSREKLTPTARELLEKQLREIEEDKYTIDVAVKMLDEQEENVEKLIESEFVELETKKKEDQDKLEEEWKLLLQMEAANLEFVEQEVIDGNEALQKQREKLADKENKLKDFQSEQSRVLNQLSADKRVYALEKHRLVEGFHQEQENMDKELSSIQLQLKQVEDSFMRNSPWENEIKERKENLSALEEKEKGVLGQEEDRVKTDEAVLKSLNTEISEANKELEKITNYDRFLDDQYEEEEKKLEEKLKSVKQIEEQTEKVRSELMKQKQEFEIEKKKERAIIEAEKLRAQDIQKQERMQRMVEEQVKQRLGEEKVQREKELLKQQQREMEEREQMMAELREAHQKEIKELQEKLRRNSIAEVDVTPMSNGNIVNSREEKRKEYLQSIDGPLTYNTSDLRDPIRVSIPKFWHRGHGWDSYHEFEVHISVLDEMWVVYRRYSKFRELHDYMRSKYPKINALQFPPKRLFGNKSDKVVQKRKHDLENYLMNFVTICQKNFKVSHRSWTRQSPVETRTL